MVDGKDESGGGVVVEQAAAAKEAARSRSKVRVWLWVLSGAKPAEKGPRAEEEKQQRIRPGTPGMAPWDDWESRDCQAWDSDLQC